MQITNNHNISLPLAVWLLNDEYDYDPRKKVISITSLQKSVRQVVLSKRVDYSEVSVDVSNYIASRMGNAIHDSIERAWISGGQKHLETLGIPANVIDRVRINPTPEELAADPTIIAAYFEQRREKPLNGWIVRGKFDNVLDGRLHDFKTTSVYTYLLGRKDDDYAKQGGGYRWLFPDLIQDDYIYINFLFTDWQKAQTFSNPNYPRLKILEHPIKMLSYEETEEWIAGKLALLDRFMDAPEDKIPECTDEELWRKPATYAYYSDPTVFQGRAGKTFEDLAAARQYLQVDKKGKGHIVTRPSEAKACAYCPAAPVCGQFKRLFNV